jgi:hypothetical protein
MVLEDTQRCLGGGNHRKETREMTKYKIWISKEVTNGKENTFFNRSKEETIFQIILTEEQIDIMSVMRKIVEGKGVEQEDKRK